MFEPTFIHHHGERVLRLEFAALSLQELLAALDTAGRLIRSKPSGSLRILSMLTARFNAESAEAFKRHGLANGPHVRASAVVGTSFWKVVATSLQVQGREDLALFEDEPSALDWLAAQ